MENYPNWLELPRDATLNILMKLTALEILQSAQFVSKMWYILCKEPSLWRTIRMKFDFYFEPDLSVKHSMLRNAVDRSVGGLIHLDIEEFASDRLLAYVASRSSHLKRLRLGCCSEISVMGVLETAEKLTSLKELELTRCYFLSYASPIIKACSTLITFKFNKDCSRNEWYKTDEDALAIAESMPELRHLQLIGNGMTNVGLTAILDGCPHLQSLDLRACFHLDLAENLRKRVSEHIKDFRGPNDSTDDYNYPTEQIACDDDDYEYDMYERIYY